MDNSLETWLPLPRDQAFEISDLGRIRRGDRLRKAHQCKDGYWRITLRGGPRQTFTLHDLVASAFLGERPANAVIAHKNRDKSDNRSANLMYTTQSANNLHKAVCPLLRICNGKPRWMRKPEPYKARGEASGRSKISEATAREIHRLGQLGEMRRSIADRLGVSYATVTQILSGRSWRHLHPNCHQAKLSY